MTNIVLGGAACLILLLTVTILATRSSKRGAVAFAALGSFAALGLCLLLFACVTFIPPYFRNYEFQDEVDDIARVNSYTQKTDEDIRAIVLKKAENLGVPLNERQILVSRNADSLTLEVRYSVRSLGVPLNFIVHSKKERP